jgi:hypothetical protein
MQIKKKQLEFAAALQLKNPHLSRPPLQAFITKKIYFFLARATL